MESGRHVTGRIGKTRGEIMVGHGRQVIYSDAASITAANVVDELKLAAAIHTANEQEIKYLYDYYKGTTPIENKTNEIRPDINNKVTENRASEIVTFKTGFLLGEPIQYISKKTDNRISDMIRTLNEYMESESKAAMDNALAKWAHICGTAYRLTLPDVEADVELSEAPFTLIVPDPRDAFVIYSSAPHHRPIAGVVVARHRDGRCDYNIYTKTDYYLVRGSDWTKVEHKRILHDDIPLIEYPLNMERMGAFEKVLPLLDALNVIQSERVDDVEQYVKSFLAILGADLSDDDVAQLQRLKMLCLPEGTDAKFLTMNLRQADTQTLKNDLTRAINEICCMPNRNGGSSTSDTGSAVIYRDGWQDAETDAQNTELSFRLPEKRFLRLVFGLCRNNSRVPIDLALADVDIKFTRRNFANLSAKVSAFATLAGIAEKGMLHLKDAYTISTLFTDPDAAFAESLKWKDELSLIRTSTEEQQIVEPEDNLEGSDGGESSAS